MAKVSKTNIARAHHYLPQFYLSGFTSSGDKKGTLYVHDLVQLKSWPSNPADAGHQKDFYRINLPNRSPDEIEKVLGLIETPASIVIKAITATNTLPAGSDFGVLMQFIALMAVRVPRLRKQHAEFEENWTRQFLKQYAKLPPDRLAAKLEKYKKDNPGSELTVEQLIESLESDEYEVTVTQDGHMHTLIAGGLANVPFLASVLGQRRWYMLVAGSAVGEFVCTDDPVVLDWLIDEPTLRQVSPGFGMLDTVVHMPLTKYHALVGVLDGANRIKILHGSALPASNNLVAITNRLVTKRASRFVYSAKPDFVWKKEDGTIGNKDDFLACVKEAQNTKAAT